MSVDSLPDTTRSPISYTVNPESLRVVVYVFFTVIMLVGYLITTTFSEHAIHHNTLKDLWGYNNLCVVFDHPPATYVLPTLYAVNLFFIALYFASSWLRCRSEHQSGKISKRGFTGYTIVTSYEFLAFCILATVFAVSPDENLIMHALPFINFIIGLSMLSVKNFWYHNQTMDLSPRQKALGGTYVSIHILVSLIYVLALINGFFGDLWYCTLCYETVHLIINRAWLLTGVIMPIGIALYLRKKEKNVLLTVATTSSAQ